MNEIATQKAGHPVSPWLPLVLRLAGVSFIVFFGIALLGILTSLDKTMLQSGPGQLLMRLVRWGQQGGGGEHYELMISAIYIVWGAFLWKVAANPLGNKVFLDFTVTANLAHFGLMFLQGLLMQGEHIHLLGDVLLGWLLLGVLMAVWLPARRYAH